MATTRGRNSRTAPKSSALLTFEPMLRVAPAISAVKLEHALGQVDAENVDIYDEAPSYRSWSRRSVSPGGEASGPSQSFAVGAGMLQRAAAVMTVPVC